MNRRRLILIALAIVLPLAIFGVAKWATRWRPVEMARFDGSRGRTDAVEASQTLVAAGEMTVDLETGAKTPLHGQLLGAGSWTWQRVTAPQTPGYLALDDGAGEKRTYPLPGVGGEWDFSFVAPIARCAPAADRLEMISNGVYYRWKWQSRRLERRIKVRDLNQAALARDGETIVYPQMEGIDRVSTRTGRVVSTVRLQGIEFFETIRVSPRGTYALYETPHRYFTQHVVDTRTGRALWDAHMDNNNRDAVFSPDEKWLAVPQAKRKLWEVREARSGQLVRALPLVPDLDAAAFAPDNGTLYSVAKGVLYRQRAR